MGPHFVVMPPPRFDDHLRLEAFATGTPAPTATHHQRASPPLRQTFARRIRHLGTASRHAHHFFAAVAFMISISRSRSAKSFFSRAFIALGASCLPPESHTEALAPGVDRLLAHPVLLHYQSNGSPVRLAKNRNHLLVRKPALASDSEGSLSTMPWSEKPGAGHVHLAIDDHSRLAFSQVTHRVVISNCKLIRCRCEHRVLLTQE
jgi:hypothetical protein